MKITILGSSQFRKNKIEVRDQLLKMGHEPLMDDDTEILAKGDNPELLNLVQAEPASAKIERNYIKWYHDLINQGDAVLVLNYEKKSIPGYIGGNTLMELGFAYVNDKKIFLLNSIPDMPYRDEIEAVLPIILDGDLSKIE